MVVVDSNRVICLYFMSAVIGAAALALGLVDACIDLRDRVSS